MGFGSLNIALHEVAKLLRYAGAKDFSFIRMGTSGGLGAEPGTVIITKEAYDATCEPGYEVVSCGKKVRYDAKADEKLNEGIFFTISSTILMLLRVHPSSRGSLDQLPNRQHYGMR